MGKLLSPRQTETVVHHKITSTYGQSFQPGNVSLGSGLLSCPSSSPPSTSVFFKAAELCTAAVKVVEMLALMVGTWAVSTAPAPLEIGNFDYLPWMPTWDNSLKLTMQPKP